MNDRKTDDVDAGTAEAAGMDAATLAALLKELHRSQDKALRAQFDRSLPFADGLFDRWERAKRLGFADGANIYDSAIVYGKVEVGAKTWIGPYAILDGSGGRLTIGAYCSISSGVHIYTHDTVYWALSGGELEKHAGSVSIGDCCYIGSQSVIVPNVTIGERCLIAANSLVREDVPANTVVGGTPARPLGRVQGSGADVTIEWLRSQKSDR